ncbi:carbohydrate ABC transporter membrane protein 2, CUT1 family (TC 3.A.1.1.-) [Gemmobacter aquatilis]|uniref:Carbohydrate ABC transporter membrane protein 2, CUT1 family (TC 3.A.1.1.-) n=1 Tax=Gemmobacter aquatilis TaxID=933059 RepID=A0A1H8FKN6_9RHOB|nr:carbohydrate ABC transporter permease [Gemmobacter aquatilis]SEN32186.1 carbohydrate ABC transporter membrane protein 2, CUT1 family (TC 3.A.1.1.-) [Gemmobacter aquatilis]
MVSLILRNLARVTLAFLVLIALTPILWTTLGAFKRLRDIVTPVPKLFFSPTLENFATILGSPTIRDGLVNSVIVVAVAVGLGAVLGIPAAHTLARHARRWGDDAQFFVLSLRFMPPVAIAIPFIVIYLDLGIYDSLGGLILVYLVTTISTVIWLAVPAFERVPREIEEAAAMEGCREAEVFWRFSLPIAAPSLFGALVFTFVLVWNELLLALTLAAQNATLPVVAASITSLGKEVPWGVINAATVVLVLPPLVFIGLLMGLINSMVRAGGPKKG